MARRRRAEKRLILPDSRYESPVVGRLISAIMQRGKKSLAQRIVYGAIDSVNDQNSISGFYQGLPAGKIVNHEDFRNG